LQVIKATPPLNFLLSEQGKDIFFQGSQIVLENLFGPGARRAYNLTWGGNIDVDKKPPAVGSGQGLRRRMEYGHSGASPG